MNEHYPQCPLHEDYELTEKEQERIDPAEVLDLVRAADETNSTNRWIIRKALQPFLWLLDCRCEEIKESYREKAAEDRAERQDR